MSKRKNPAEKRTPAPSSGNIDRSGLPPEVISWGELKRRYRRVGPKPPSEEDEE